MKPRTLEVLQATFIATLAEGVAVLRDAGCVDHGGSNAMTFRVGQKVVCVDDAGWESVNSRLRVGQVYTLSDVRPCPCGKCDIPAVWLVEIQCPIREGYYAALFRPAVSPKQEVSFTQGADPESERYDNRRPVVEPMPVDGWRVSVKT